MEIKTKAYGYIRVSTKEQNEVRQVIALREVGVSEKNIYMEEHRPSGTQLCGNFGAMEDAHKG